MHPSDRGAVQQNIDLAIHTGKDFAQDYRLLLGGGTTKYVHSIGHPVTNKYGEIIEIIGAATEITDRVYSERALKRSEFYLAEAEKISHTGCWGDKPHDRRTVLVAGGNGVSSASIQERRQNKRILVSAAKGERDRERLLAVALDAA